MEKRKSIRSITLVLLLSAVCMLADGCASSRSNNKKKLKPGKPIPCPQKDC